ncbi:hypothetical protein AGMMS50289_23520 [Betaproteobacteria bacterium]|nr:hypothetical protein AGMMS50289_23520 [Betaproteobacteria bacterium]
MDFKANPYLTRRFRWGGTCDTAAVTFGAFFDPARLGASASQPTGWFRAKNLKTAFDAACAPGVFLDGKSAASNPDIVQFRRSGTLHVPDIKRRKKGHTHLP